MNTEHLIYNLYLRRPPKLASMRSIALKLNKSYPFIHQHLTKLISSGLLKKTIVGKSNLCGLNYDNPGLLSTLSLTESLRLQKELETNSSLAMLYHFVNKEFIHGLLSCIYSKDKSSLYFIITDESVKENIAKTFSKTTFAGPIKFIVASKFSEQLKSSDAIITSKRFVLYGGEIFHALIKENLGMLTQKIGAFENE